MYVHNTLHHVCTMLIYTFHVKYIHTLERSPTTAIWGMKYDYDDGMQVQIKTAEMITYVMHTMLRMYYVHITTYIVLYMYFTKPSFLYTYIHTTNNTISMYHKGAR